MGLYVVQIDTTRPDIARDEIERAVSTVFHKPVQVRQIKPPPR